MKITRRCFLCLAAGVLGGCSQGDDTISELYAELSSERTFDTSSLTRDDASLYTEARQRTARENPHRKVVPHPAMYGKKLSGQRVRCELCPHFCELDESDRGICNTRINQGGDLYTLAYGLANPGAHPTNVKEIPLHLQGPDKPMVSIGLVGCGLRCDQCLFGDVIFSRPEELGARTFTPEEVARFTADAGSPCIIYTNSEPTNNFEFTLDTAKAARKLGLYNILSTAGYVNVPPLKELVPYMDGSFLGWKGFSEASYGKLTQGSLEPVKQAALVLRDGGVLLEHYFLMIPTMNDREEEIRAFATWIHRNFGPYSLVCFSRFYPTFRLRNLPPTPMETLKKAKEISESCGLKNVNIYLGSYFGYDNIFSEPDFTAATYCPYCGKLLLKYNVGLSSVYLVNNLEGYHCKFCGKPFPGTLRLMST
ncbi:MAG: radical SAM protein [Proteobacteria bacterium]|nr:radical SAM protein [Pseudomonadota bacterium]